MKTLKLREVISQGKYEVAAHMIVFGLVKASQKEKPERVETPRGPQGQPERS